MRRRSEEVSLHDHTTPFMAKVIIQADVNLVRTSDHSTQMA